MLPIFGQTNTENRPVTSQHTSANDYSAPIGNSVSDDALSEQPITAAHPPKSSS